MKIIVPIVFFICIIGSLGAALFFMMRDKGKTSRTAYALTARIALSVVLFLLVMGAYKMGWIHPNSLH